MKIYFLILVGWDLDWPDNVPQIKGFTLRDETTFFAEAGSFKTEEDLKTKALKYHGAKDNNLTIKAISQLTEGFRNFTQKEELELTPIQAEES